MPTPLKREIGYVKPKPSKKIEAVPTVKSGNVVFKNGKFKGPASLSSLPVCQKEPEAKEIVAWIKAHPLFKWGGMCIKLGTDKGNFLKMMNSGSFVIKPELADKMVAIIKDYGFKP